MTWHKTSERLPEHRTWVIGFYAETPWTEQAALFFFEGLFYKETVDGDDLDNTIMELPDYWRPIPLSKCCGWPYEENLSSVTKFDIGICHKCGKPCEVSE